MKKVLITMAVLTSMVAGGMVFSSFAAPKTNDKSAHTQINANNGWRKVGVYFGQTDNGKYGHNFAIWEKDGMCNAYYWVDWSCDPIQGNLNPDETRCSTGALRKNSEGRWYCAQDGYNYYINF